MISRWLPLCARAGAVVKAKASAPHARAVKAAEMRTGFLAYMADPPLGVECRRPGRPRLAARLFERLQTDNRSAVIAPDPERDGRGRVVDEHAADVRLARPQILDGRSSHGIEPQDAVAGHRSAPQLAVLVDEDVVR